MGVFSYLYWRSFSWHIDGEYPSVLPAHLPDNVDVDVVHVVPDAHPGSRQDRHRGHPAGIRLNQLFTVWKRFVRLGRIAGAVLKLDKQYTVSRQSVSKRSRTLWCHLFADWDVANLPLPLFHWQAKVRFVEAHRSVVAIQRVEEERVSAVILDHITKRVKPVQLQVGPVQTILARL